MSWPRWDRVDTITLLMGVVVGLLVAVIIVRVVSWGCL